MTSNRMLSLLLVAGVFTPLVVGCSDGGEASSGRISTVASAGFYRHSISNSVLPSVEGGIGQEPRIDAAVGPAPTTLVSEWVSESGVGNPGAGIHPLVRYVETAWRTGAVLHNDWKDEAPAAQLVTDDRNRDIAGVLSDKPVNSRFEVAVPSAGGATLWVIDIVAPGPP